MRIAYVHDVIYPYVKGGSEKRVWEISRRLAAKGHEVHIFGMKYWDGEDAVEREGVHLHGVCDPLELYVEGKRSIRAAIRFSWSLLWSLRGDFDVIDSQQFPYLPCFSAKLFSTLKRTPLIITWHEVWGDYWDEYLGWMAIFGKAVERLTARLPDRIIPVSERVRLDLLSMGVESERMVVVPNGVDLEKIDSVGARDPAYDLVYAGRLSAHKRVDLLIEAVGLLKEEIPEIRCAIIGDGPEMEDLGGLVRGLKVEDNVDFLGFLDTDEEVIAGVKSSRIFVLPSTREGFGISLLEANACGLPVVTVRSEMNAASDLVEDGLNGMVVDLSPEAVAGAILDLLKEEKHIGLSEPSRKVAERYDWSAVTDAMEREYEKVAS
ncbi:glycosyltransferase family 4 protein [Methanocrinis sp.]|uniref:glycosyltransferase family 4 protein n=1 Tax=Methanocrinis sp. TaxID=3101522 RepID=UPI003D0B8AA8